jgi:hypothetical protein
VSSIFKSRTFYKSVRYTHSVNRDVLITLSGATVATYINTFRLFSLIARASNAGTSTFAGTVKHQFSPRLLFEFCLSKVSFPLCVDHSIVYGSINALNPQSLNIGTVFTTDQMRYARKEGGCTIEPHAHSSQVRITTSLSTSRSFPPTFALTLHQRLYCGVTGMISYHSGWPFLFIRKFQKGHKPRGTFVASSFILGLRSQRWVTSIQIPDLILGMILKVEREFRLTNAIMWADLLAHSDL